LQWGIMIGTFDYRERISECPQWAEKAANDQAKGLWKEMERFWRARDRRPSGLRCHVNLAPNS